ncbi:hypothetical protein NDI76_09345 [Halogeometricum sp. S1BR25-6]|uniref:DUF8173 domain-containing protein n=1 Tax=Halogeometricum salsisoli TaxID=2950536 RepID=A0ABU2GDQ9_9EURY|nr:hypothetical protein [Halogeometricum sp. S1BR25-6]MDS0298950.1 hypothetical protein [Halogeometricum sp. S1BR25-6]
MPSARVNSEPFVASVVAFLAGVTCVATFVEPAAAQTVPEMPRAPVFGPLLAFVVALVLNLLFGAFVLGVAPQYSRALVARIRSQPVESFVYGLLTLVSVFVAVVALTITVIGIVVVIPGVIVVAIVGLAANLLAMVAFGAVLARAAGSADPWKSLVVGAVAVSVLSIVPVVGDLTNFVLGTVGMGAVASRYWENRKE